MIEQCKQIGIMIQELDGSAVWPQKGENQATHKQLEIIENLFKYLGELFINRSEENENKLTSFVDEIGHKLITSRVPLKESINLIYLSRCSIMEMLEKEFRAERLTTDTFFESLKTIEYLYQLISKTLVNCYNEELFFTKYALDESNKDLTITLRELTDLQQALDEATIFSITDQNDRITYANDRFCHLYQYSREELIGKKHDLFFSDFHPSSFFEEILETLRNGTVWNGEILNKAKDGRRIWLDTTFVPFVDANGEHYQHMAIQYDITERKNTEETLQKTEKLSMIGELAAGIAHEIRNPLTTIRGFVQLMGENGNVEPYRNTILEEIDRINFIVNEFMVFAKPHTVYYSHCDISDILKSVINLLAPEALLKNVIIVHDIPSEGIFLNGEKNQLKQVFINLIKNSIDAMPAGGKIRVSLDRDELHILIKIKDDGVGMEEEQIKRLGEPFFSTKHDGNGLGLMVSYKIIHNHQGTINVKSQPNGGTTFNIRFKTQ
jgi:PAS domain S-box-containing protein